MVLSKALCVAASLASVLASLPVRAETFATSDQNPLLSGFGLATPWTARIAPSRSQTLTSILNWSSTAVIQTSDATTLPSEQLTVDTETREWRIDWQRSLTDRIALRVKLPYQTINGGSLDSFIDNWHQAFGMPQGARPVLPHNQYRIDYRRNGSLLLADTQARSGLGNLQVEAGYQLLATDHYATSVWMSTKLPTSDNDNIGSSALDVGSGIASEFQLNSRWNVFTQAALIHLGRGHALADQQREWISQAFVNVDYRYSKALTLNIQFEAHSAVFRDSTLKLLSNTVLLTAGGRYRFNNQWQAQFGVGEDIKVDSSPDVNFLFSLSRSWR